MSKAEKFINWDESANENLTDVEFTSVLPTYVSLLGNSKIRFILL